MEESTRRSLEELSAEVASNPNSTAFVELAAAYRARGDLERAMRLCLRGLQRHPTHVEAHFELGRIYEARGERELALDEWGVVLQLAPEHLNTRLTLVRLYLDEGRQSDATAELERAETIAPGDPRLNEFRGLLDSGLAPPEAEGESGNGRGHVFESLGEDHPGTLGILLVDAEGEIIESHMPAENGDVQAALGTDLIEARAEAERVASYLQLGELKGMVVESKSARLTVSPVGRDVVIVATRTDLPAGQAALVVQRAWDLAESYLSNLNR
ncbi:MAG: tetratricopeptide repeat protein [Gemmatimonadetes bacterium]|uniref:Tetratricopeptide repeat protein n=1 Tax=Candidatus Kutchimonas denitrificans TaxID=3056748 RepID=A0AAE4Z8P0_9BACT|nr:tetratricopeptide repeat protein [Gemmatimonadota bacterium]NIR74527.1 tetratricopeptide repeat protein [Candidatus Kutchimonas denitrificans]NIS02717.1 tetratricopeptide repeat protein [Gemmatimonadota bacterium]NIT68878.1 tetratricopeptide repeat protein [Gemmatimonadota bacterium]NIU52183.1 tetratricopeptide repeat protein [Gemmatimonadota bacterium]